MGPGHGAESGDGMRTVRKQRGGAWGYQRSHFFPSFFRFVQALWGVRLGLSHVAKGDGASAKGGHVLLFNHHSWPGRLSPDNFDKTKNFWDVCERNNNKTTVEQRFSLKNCFGI